MDTKQNTNIFKDSNIFSIQILEPYEEEIIDLIILK